MRDLKSIALLVLGFLSIAAPSVALAQADTTPPTVVSFTRVGPATVAPMTRQQYNLVFSEPVTGVSINSFSSNTSGFLFHRLIGVTGSGANYVIDFDFLTGNGEFWLALQGGTFSGIRDLAGNPPATSYLVFSERYTVTSNPQTSYRAPSPTGTGAVTATLTSFNPSCTFTSAAFIPVSGDTRSPPAGSAPSGVVFPHGLFTFTIDLCTSATITITYPQAVAGAVYWKYGPTPTDVAPHWYVMPASTSGNTVTLFIADGDLGDDDLTLNGRIVDQGGPGFGVGAATPTLSQWVLLLLALLVVVSTPALRRRL